MTLAEMIAAYRIAAHDRATPPFTSDAALAGFLNEAQREACIRARLIYEKDAAYCQIAVLPGQSVIALDPLIAEIRHASLEGADGVRSTLQATDRRVLDRERPQWRTRQGRPEGYLHDDTSLTLDASADAPSTLKLEVYRFPEKPLLGLDDVPEIAERHHRHLVDWALFCAYSVPDAEIFNPGKAIESEARFERHFGASPGANLRRRQNANRPHRNVPCW